LLQRIGNVILRAAKDQLFSAYRNPPEILEEGSRALLSLFLAVAALTALGVVVWYAVAAPESQWLGRSLTRGPGDSPAVALTFDDGPGEQTPPVLDLLKQANVRATFFLCGENVERFPDLARRIADEGHEIGNHTYSHPRLLGRTPGKIALEIDRAQKVIEHRTGRVPRWFRPPYGLRWFGLFPILRSRGLAAAMWSVNAKDWRVSADRIVERVVRGAHPGAIILLHDGLPPRAQGNRQATVEALPRILQELSPRYRFVGVSEMQRESQTH
jgi:peptidoglycan/xylan/chitin deacetylase (PgdA/CDA1 family)